jgi:DNA helicase-2/ATP-dependent DNA helicase PcrA
VRIDTLNRWGYNYLRKNVSSSLALKVGNKDMFTLVKHLLRPVWAKHSRIENAISGSPNKYINLMRVIDALKTTGFRHDADELVPAFERHLQWIENCGLARYFETNIQKDLDSMGLLPGKPKSCVETFSQFIRFWKQACDHLWASAIITLDDQKYWTLLTLQQKYRDSAFPEPNRHHHIMVDEFQDINPLDLFLVQELVRVNRSTLTIVGDDDQAIFEWRGAVPRFIFEPDRFFGAPFETHTLATNYRSPPNILHHSQLLIAHNRYRVAKDVHAASTTTADIVHKCFGSHDEAVGLVVEMARKAAEEGTPKALAVLSRKKSQLIPLQIMLASEKIPFYAKEDLNVLLSEAFEDLRTILEALATRNDRRSLNEAVKTFLQCCNKVRTYPLPQACSKALYGYLMSRAPRTFMKCLEEFIRYPGEIRTSHRDTPAEYGLAIAKVMEAETVAEAVQLIESEMAGLRRHYGKGEDDIFYKDPPFLHLADFAQRYDNDFLRFIDDVDAAIASMARVNDVADDAEAVDEDLQHPIHLMTALRAKGKEYETVVVLDANNGMWPIRHAETEAELEQERRVFYVAVTRARRRLLLLTVDQLVGRPMSVTPYVAEMGLQSVSVPLA